MWKTMRPERMDMNDEDLRHWDKDTIAGKDTCADLIDSLCPRKNRQKDSHHLDTFKPHIKKIEFLALLSGL